MFYAICYSDWRLAPGKIQGQPLDFPNWFGNCLPIVAGCHRQSMCIRNSFEWYFLLFKTTQEDAFRTYHEHITVFSSQCYKSYSPCVKSSIFLDQSKVHCSILLSKSSQYQCQRQYPRSCKSLTTSHYYLIYIKIKQYLEPKCHKLQPWHLKTMMYNWNWWKIIFMWFNFD